VSWSLPCISFHSKFSKFGLDIAVSLCSLSATAHLSLLNKSNRVVPFLIIRVVSFPRYHLSTDPAYTLTYFYIWTQTALYISLITSITPCLKPFVAGLNTGYGAFDTEHVAEQTFGSYGFNGYASKKKPIQRSSQIPSKSAGSFANGLRSLGGGVNGRKRSTVDGRSGQASTVAKNMKLILDPKTAGQSEERAGGIATTQAPAATQDGNSIGSNDSQQMIIRKDVAWKVEC
jgi:hypothetical protein